MSKYDEIPITLHTARVEHNCITCGKVIHKGEEVVYQKDSLINQVASQKKYCEACFNKHGQKLGTLKENGNGNQKGLG